MGATCPSGTLCGNSYDGEKFFVLVEVQWSVAFVR
jgi:hypothetical protein